MNTFAQIAITIILRHNKNGVSDVAFFLPPTKKYVIYYGKLFF